jgi:PPOX class probable F420-dependent enzyme
MADEPTLDDDQRAFLADARRAVLSTIDSAGRPRLVPICFVLDATDPIVFTPLDDKPKRVARPHDLARVRDIVADPRVSILVDQWDEDWTRLAWLRCSGRATLVEADGSPTFTGIIGALRAKYPQYETQSIDERPLLRIVIERVTAWSAATSLSLRGS